MPVAARWIYLDHAAVSPIPEPSRQAMFDYVNQLAEAGDTAWPGWASGVELGRTRASELLDCHPDEIALVPNTTYGINVVAQGLRWRPGENLVVPANEFPSNLLPWRLLERQGVEVRLVDGEDDLLIDRLIDAIDERTKLVSVSWVHYLTGYRADLARICEAAHRFDSYLMVDAIQGLGAFPLSLREIPVDFLAADGHKWMLGPEGAGILFVRRELLEELEPLMMGWGSLQHAHRFDPTSMQLRNKTSRYEGGSANMAGILGFSASLDLLLQAGVHRQDNPCSDSIIELASRLQTGLECMGVTLNRNTNSDRQSGIVSFKLPNRDSSLVRTQLAERKIVVSVRHDRLRVAIHAYNTAAEIDQLIASLAEIAR